MADPDSRCVLIVYNSSEYVVRFRKPLIEGLQAAGFVVHVLAPVDGFTPALRAVGVTFHPWQLGARTLSPVSEWRSQREARRCADVVQPSLILSFTIKGMLHAALVARRRTSVRHLPTLTGRGDLFRSKRFLMRLMRRVLTPLYRRCLQDADRVFVQNPDDAEFLQTDFGVNAERIVQVAGSGVDTEALQPGNEEPDYDLVMVARLTQAKGVGDFAAALQLLRDDRPALRAVLAGPLVNGAGAVSEAQLRRWSEDVNLQYLGFVSDATDVIRRGRIYVLPTLGEGMPRTVLEAMALGRPVITSDVAGCRDAVIDGVTGLLVPPSNPTALADALRTLLDDPERCREMGAAGRQRAEAHFNDRQVAAGYLEVIEALADRSA